MTPETTSLMPMGIAAALRSTPPPLPQLSMPPSPSQGPSLPMPPGGSPSIPADPVPSMPPSGQVAGMPPAAAPTMAPAPPPWTVSIQDDGSSVYQLPPLQPGGKPVIIGVNKAPRLPAALQPPKPTAAPQ